MAKFVLTAQLELQAPKNAASVINNLQRQLNSVTIPLQVKGAKQAAQQINQVTNSAKMAGSAAEAMGRSFGLAIKRFAAFTVASRAVSLFTNSLARAVDEAISFQREMVKISQVTGKSVKQLKDLENTITSLSVGLGVSSKELLSTARILSQAGFQAQDLGVALEALAKTTLAPTFDDITQTAEGAVAIFNQFGEGAGALERQFGAINAVAGQFAVESSDLIGAVRRVGGVFKSSGGSLEELLALFTSIRATTRESAESIATGLRTILTRIQRPKTIQFLKEFGVNLTDLDGKFVGPFEAARRLSKVFSELEQGDIRFVRVAEELGGFRQIGKVIPLLQQFGVAQDALNAATEGGTSLSEDAATAQQALAVQITKVKEEFLALVRSIAGGESFQLFARTALEVASALIKVADALKPLIPLIGTIAAFKFARGLGGFAASAGSAIRGIGKNQGGVIQAFARGGFVPGSGNRDTVPAMLTPGEFVIKKSSAQKLGAGTLQAMNENRYAKGGLVIQRMNDAEYAGLFAKPRGEDSSGKPVSIVPDQGVEGGNVLATIGAPKSYFIGNTDEEKFTQKADSVLRRGINEIVATLGIDSKTANKADDNIINDIGVSDIAGKIFEGVTRAAIGDFRKGEGSQQTFDVRRGLDEEGRKTLSQLFNSGNILPDIDYDNKLSESRSNRASLVKKAVNASKKDKRYILDEILIAKFANSLSTDQILQQQPTVANKDVARTRREEVLLAKRNLGNKIPDADAKKVVENRLSSELKKIDKYIAKTTTAVRKKATGGSISGGDTVPALLTPGEFVVNKKAAQSIGYGNLNSMNKTGVARFAKGGAVQTFANGGSAQATTGGGGFDANKLVLFTAAAGFAQAALEKLGDASAKASDSQARTTITLQKLLSASLVLFAGYTYAIKPLLAFTNKMKEASKVKIDTAQKDVDSSKFVQGKIQGQFEKQKLSKEIADTRLARATAVDLARKEQFNKAASNPSDTAELSKSTTNLVKSNKRLAEAQKAADKANKKLKGARDALNKQTYKTIQAENKLAKERFKSLGGQAARGGAVGLGTAAALVTIGNQIASGFEQWFKRAEEQAKASDNLAQAVAASGAAVIAQGVGELFSLQGLISSAIDPKGFVGGIIQRKESAEFDTASGFIQTRSQSALEKVGTEGFAEANKGALEAFATARSEAGDLTGAARDKANKQLDAASRKYINDLDASGASIEDLKQSASSLAGGNDQLRQSLLKQIETIESNRKAQEALSKANFDALKITSAFGAAADASARLVAGLETGVDSLALYSQELESASGKLGVDAKAAIDAAEKELLGSLSGADESTRRAVAGQADVARATNQFGVNAGAQLGNLDISAGEKGKEQIEKALQDAIPTDADSATKAKLEDVIRKNVAAIQGDPRQVDLSKLAQDVLSQGQELSKGFNEAVKLQSQHNATMSGLYQKREALEQQAAAAANQAIETQLEAAKIFEEFGGSRLTGEQQLGARVAQFNNIGGLGGLGAQLTTGSASDIRSVASEMAQTFADQTDEVVGSAIARGVGGTGAGPFAGAGGFAADKRPEIEAANKALLQFTKQRISLLKEELTIVQKKNAEEKSALESLISGDVEGFLDRQAASGAGAALASGSAGLAGLFSASALGAGFKTLGDQGLSDQQLRQAENLTLQRFGIQGTGVLSGTTPEEEAIKAQGRELAGVLGELSQQEAAFAQAAISVNNATITAAQLSFDRTLSEVSRRNAGTTPEQQTLARGGIVYASKGMFIPRGTDTVPAMLTPGEFVVNRSAVQRGNNLQILRAMNTGGGASAPGAMSGGGQVRYYNFGGLVDGISSAFSGALPQLTTVFSDFAATVEKLVNTRFNVAIDPTNINVNFNGASFLDSLKTDLKDELLKEVGNEIQRYRSNNSGDLVKKDSLL